MNRTIVLLSVLLCCSSQFVCAQRTLRGRIVDANSGQPLMATVSVKNSDGNDIPIEGHHDLVDYLGKKRWYVEGEFTVITFEDKLDIEIRRGPETLPLIVTVDLTGETGGAREFRLERWTDMGERGYMSGDSHIHYLDPGTAHRQMQAEDLRVVNLLTSDFTNDLEIFTGTLDKVSTGEHFVYTGQEIRDWQLGHANLLNLKSIVQPLIPFGGSLFSMGSNPNLLLVPRLEEARSQGATNVWAHFSNLPGLESVIAFPLGLIDAVELMTYDDPTMLPSHWAAWDYSDLPPVEFPPMRGMDLYYQYLNAGFRLPITAGTDKMGDHIPVGSNRNYVRVEGEMNYHSWIAGMKKGRGFITNGPMLTFSVDGHLSGDTIRFQGEETVRARLKAESTLPFGRVEIVANGKTIAWKYMEDYGKKREVYSAELDIDIPLSASTWIIGRVTSLDTPQMLPRNLTVFGHSNPVYFLKDGQPVNVEGSVRYLLNYLKSTRNWIRNRAAFATEEERNRALMYLEKAGYVLKKKEK